MDHHIVEFAKMLLDRNNPEIASVLIGTVEEGFPDIKIRLNDNIILDKSYLVFAAHTLSDYQRQFTSDGDITIGTTNSYSSSGTITLTDTFSVGDQVIIMPTQSKQLYYVLDKAVRL